MAHLIPGLIFQCALVQMTPPYLRTKACRLVVSDVIFNLKKIVWNIQHSV